MSTCYYYSVQLILGLDDAEPESACGGSGLAIYGNKCDWG